MEIGIIASSPPLKLTVCYTPLWWGRVEVLNSKTKNQLIKKNLYKTKVECYYIINQEEEEMFLCQLSMSKNLKWGTK